MNDIQRIEKFLFDYIPEDARYDIKNLLSSMRYSLSAGGKRLRPRLVLEFARLCGGSDEAALPYACAVEMIHTYSLIHDDLPCMDDDDLRRGKPSNHKVYGEDTALLAGDALQSHAFDIMTNPEYVSAVGAQAACRCVQTLARRCGTFGMVGGQIMDLAYEDREIDLDTLRTIQELKTGALISAACEMGCHTAGADAEKVQAAFSYGDYLGQAFQIVDDILDVVSTTEQLGKPVGSDEKNNKSTFVSLLGIEKCKERVRMLTDKAIAELDKFDGDKTALTELANSMVNRKF